MPEIEDCDPSKVLVGNKSWQPFRAWPSEMPHGFSPRVVRCGDPLRREPERVREDVLSPFISFERSRDVYGVVFDNTDLSDALAIDEEGTTRQREILRAAR